MRQTKVEREQKTSAPAPSRSVEINDAVTWLSQHVGFPALSRKQYEARLPRRRPA